ncbi:uncharacterized protein LOC143912106 isoform X1 [Arctopsyche grandis]|uniref:uncharacterized protein LOC143912106 isoform X1 n=1 Tax=Arctopsyche grandis TaxID=121162 RepID=UPI00406D9830
MSKAPIVLSASIKNKLNFGKKRQARVAEWSDNKRKKLRNSGQSYISRKGKEVMSKRRPEEELSCNCRYPECRKISIEEKKTFFENFYKLNYDEQSQFLKGCIEIKKPRRRTVPEETSRRHCSVKYTVQLNERVQVCQKSLCNMLDITKRRLEILLQKIKDGDNIRDQRGKHLNRPHKISDEDSTFNVKSDRIFAIDNVVKNNQNDPGISDNLSAQYEKCTSPPTTNSPKFIQPFFTKRNIKPSSNENSREEDAYNFMRIASEMLVNRDESDIFGSMVATKLKKFSHRNRIIIQNYINNYIFQMELKELDNTYVSPASVSTSNTSEHEISLILEDSKNTDT